ncbi:hypothetical protein [Tautonia plasticadhaerens]|uniref:Uncharacterized protein n=1 Tax=Tautonia plasticadhaerens TaxID=2527974 RepID=A0A518H3Z2_9BACT|nr:hypothetical protein [Tautonia plasticadhaerens]QDV35546.1 hypothetical protein ElP_34490 [Tautonia plasticadhaerens]
MRYLLLLPILLVGLIVAFLATAGLVEIVENRSIQGVVALVIYGGIGVALLLVILRGASAPWSPRIRKFDLVLVSLGCAAVLAVIYLGVRALAEF